MEEEFINILSTMRDPKKIFIACAIFIFSDVVTGYLKAIKFKKINSSISRDGYIKKTGWLYSLLVGLAVKVFVGVDLILFGTGIICIGTEGISVWENLSEIGVKLPFRKYFEKLKDSVKK